MRINTIFEAFLYGSLLMPCSRMVKPLGHPEASLVAVRCQAAPAVSSLCMTGGRVQFAAAGTARGAAGATWLPGSTVATQPLPGTQQEKAIGHGERTCRPGMASWAPQLFTRDSLN